MTKEDLGVAPQYQIPDVLWERMVTLLPPPKEKKKSGRPRLDDRQAMTAIFYRLRTGCQWKALPTGLGAASTVHGRFQEWRAAGVFQRLWRMSLLKYDQAQGIDWSWLSLDGAMNKAPLGGRGHWTQPYGPGQTGSQTFLADRGSGDTTGGGGGWGQPT